MRGFRRLTFAVSGLGALALTTFGVWAWRLPLPKNLKNSPPVALTLLDIHGREIAVIGNREARDCEPIPLTAMGDLPRVTVGLEDHRFYEHHGVDWIAICAALWRDVKARRIVSGASTITEQLIKITSGHTNRSWLEKVREAVLAWKLERHWSKNRILAAYLNRCDYGNRRIGCEAAARAYFGKSVRDLSLPEAIYLAGIPQSPTRFNPWKFPQRAAQKYRRSTRRLIALTAISGERGGWLAKSAPRPQRFALPRLAPNFVDAILAKYKGLRGRVRTTLDLKLQAEAEQLLKAHLATLNRSDVQDAAMVVIDNQTGGVRALVGSQNYTQTEINGALTPRHCGSTLKPFVYLEALDRRLITAATLLPDTADALRKIYADYDPHDYNRRYFGPVRAREALACSLNVPAVEVLSRVGAREAFDRLKQWDFRFPRGFDDYGAGFILGNAEVSLLNLAGAYAGLARGGWARRPSLLAREFPPSRRMASHDAVEILTDILCDNVAREREFGSTSPLAFKRRIGVKTGTSSGFHDAWTVGFSKEHTVAVWAGNFNGQPMREMLSVRAASPLWAAMMRVLLKSDHPLDAPKADAGLVSCKIDAMTGTLPSRQTRKVMTEWFLKGTTPTKDASDFYAANGDLILPEQYAAWCASRFNDLNAKVLPSTVAMMSPANHAHYEIDPVLPREQQMIELVSTFGAQAQWSVNGERVLSRKDGRFFWQLAPGKWSAVASVGGKSVRHDFVVSGAAGDEDSAAYERMPISK